MRLFRTDAELSELRRLIDDGISTVRIAEQFGITRQYVTKFVKKLGYLPMRKTSGLIQWTIPGAVPPPAVALVVRDKDRLPLPAGHPDTWGAIVRGTLLEGQEYPQ